MTEVTIKTASSQLIEEAQRVSEVKDARGRIFGIRKVTTSIRRRMALGVAGENHSKPIYMGQVAIAASVKSIDGVDVRFPINDLQWSSLIDQIDDDGFDVIGPAYADEWLKPKEEVKVSGE